MSTKGAAVFVVVCASLLAQTVAAEPGDVNGDGRVSFGDAAILARWMGTGLEIWEPVPDFHEFSAQLECSPGMAQLSRFVYIEALRRSVEHPLPHLVDRWIW